MQTAPKIEDAKINLINIENLQLELQHQKEAPIV